MTGMDQVNGRHPAVPAAPGLVPAAAPMQPVDWAVVTELRGRVADRLRAHRDGGKPLSGADERALAAGLVAEEIERWAVGQARAGRPAAGRGVERALAAAVTAALRSSGYNGWIVVEQDVFPGYGTPKASAQKSRDYLRRLGL